MTIVPEIAKTAAHVTMLQRSPTYMASAPAQDKMANWLRRNLPAKLAYAITRWAQRPLPDVLLPHGAQEAGAG